MEMNMNYREMKGEKKMKGNSGTIAILFFSLLLVICMMSQVQAAVNCANDVDCDGFTDTQESSTGITLADGSTFPACSGTTLTRDACLDPNTPDLFVILIKATDTGGAYSNIPATNPLGLVSAPKASGGLGLAVHIITPGQANSNRFVTSTQKAVRITESLDVSATDVLGAASTGTPNGLDAAVIYTERIKKHVTGVYAGVNQLPPAGFIDDYIRHTIAHEVGHMSGPLTTAYNSRYGGYHYQSGTNLILDQSVAYSVKGGTVTWKLGKTYSTADQSAIKLK